LFGRLINALNLFTTDQPDAIQYFARGLHRDPYIVTDERPPQCRNRARRQIVQGVERVLHLPVVFQTIQQGLKVGVFLPAFHCTGPDAHGSRDFIGAPSLCQQPDRPAYPRFQWWAVALFGHRWFLLIRAER
jgi:hypothetical protein